MDIEKLIKELRDMLPEPVDYAEMVGAPAWAYGCEYVYEDPEWYLVEEAIDKLFENIQLQKRHEALLKDFKEFILHPDDVCKYCKHNQPCRGKECELYIEGRGAWDHKGCKHDWEWSCMDFNFGECPMLENTPCNGCIKNDMQGFEWRGVVDNANN